MTEINDIQHKIKNQLISFYKVKNSRKRYNWENYSYYNNELYEFPETIEYIDFQILVEYAANAILIKHNILPPSVNFDITKYPTQNNCFLEFIINIYNNCSSTKNINLDKCRKFWDTYRCLKAFLDITHFCKWDLKNYPDFFNQALFSSGNFIVIINNIKYHIHKDFYVRFAYDWTSTPYLFKITVFLAHYKEDNIIDLLDTIEEYSIDIAMGLLDSLVYLYGFNEIGLRWSTALTKYINIMKNNKYYSPDHPLSLLSNPDISNHIKKKIIIEYFQLFPSIIN